MSAKSKAIVAVNSLDSFKCRKTMTVGTKQYVYYSLIAAEKTGRVAALIEIDPIYVDVIVNRWQSFTSKKAILAASGQTFDETALGRAGGQKPLLLTHRGDSSSSNEGGCQ